MNSTLTVCSHCNTLNKVNCDQVKVKTPTCGKCQSPLKLQGLSTQVDQENFNRILAKSDGRAVVVDFWAPWCGPCKIYGPEFEKASLENTHAIFLKINVDENPELSSSLGIRGVPATLVFKNGTELERQSGAMSVSQLRSFLAGF